MSGIQEPKQYYMDKLGNQFPISNNHTPKVPLYHGHLNENQKEDLLSLIDHIDKDPFLRNELLQFITVQIPIFIGLRSYGFEVEIGQMRRIGEKLSKLKSL